MTVQDLPSIGDKMYLLQREVTVTKVYLIFQLIKIYYTEDHVEFFVDISAVTKCPDTTNSISLRLLRGDRG